MENDERIVEAAERLVNLRMRRIRQAEALEQTDAEIAQALCELKAIVTPLEKQVAPAQHIVSSRNEADRRRLVPVGRSYTRSPLRNRIIAFAQDKRGAQITTGQIAEAVNMTDEMPKLFWTLSEIRKAGFLKRVGRGVWKFNEKGWEKENQEESRDVEF